MQLVQLPWWLYTLIGLVLLATGIALGRVTLDAAGVLVVGVGAIRWVRLR